MSNIVQLRDLLAERFPGVRIASEPAPVRDIPIWATGLQTLDAALSGGLQRGALTEICITESAYGGPLLLRQLIRQAASTHQWIALVDGVDSFDPNSFDNETLEHLLWLRCARADEAVRCADLILRDGNLPIVALDLAANPARELRKIPSSTWYRFQRLVEDGNAAFVAMTPMPMASSAKHRLFLRGALPVEAFHMSEEQLLERVIFENAESQREMFPRYASAGA